MALNVICLNGFKESGKDTVFNVIQELVPYARRFAYADRLKECVWALNPWVKVSEGEPGYIEEDVWERQGNDMVYHTFPRFVRYEQLIDEVGVDEAKKCKEVRRLLQAMGTEVVRDRIEDGAWVRILMEEIFAYRTLRSKNRLAVITDCRFPNEAAVPRNQFNAEVWEIKRPGGKTDGHRSEVPLHRNLVDLTIYNNGTIDDLRITVKEILEEKELL